MAWIMSHKKHQYGVGQNFYIGNICIAGITGRKHFKEGWIFTLSVHNMTYTCDSMQGAIAILLQELDNPPPEDCVIGARGAMS